MTEATGTPTAHTANPREPESSAPGAGQRDVAGVVPTEDPEVGLAQKGSGEDAVVRRETEI